MSENNRDCCSSPDVFGGCPTCQLNDGYFNIGPDHWFFCNVHRTKWNAGSNLLSTWKYESEYDWNRNHQYLADYTTVTPIYPPSPHKTDEFSVSILQSRQHVPVYLYEPLRKVLDYLYEQELQDHIKRPPEEQKNHILNALIKLKRWCNYLEDMHPALSKILDP